MLFLDTEGTAAVSTTSSWACLPAPSALSVDDLVGTWRADFGGGTGVDTLVLNGDGTYTQSYNNSASGYHYESPPNEWRLEQRSSGGMYLHMEGMLYCAFQDRCRNPRNEEAGAGIGFYDYCERRWAEMNGEFVLSVVGFDSALLPGQGDDHIALKHFKPPGWEFFFHEYILARDKGTQGIVRGLQYVSHCLPLGNRGDCRSLKW
jgi:hypothetical protein